VRKELEVLEERVRSGWLVRHSEDRRAEEVSSASRTASWLDEMDEDLLLQEQLDEGVGDEDVASKLRPTEFVDTQSELKERPLMLRLLDKRWWDETSEEERVRQVIEWRPYDRTESKERKAHKQFKSNPFASSPIRPRTRWELDAYRSARLATFFKQDLGRLHTLLQQNLLPETAPVLPNSTHIHYNELLSALQTIEKAIVETRLSSPASSSFAAATSASSSLHGSALAGPLVSGSLEARNTKQSPRRRKRSCAFCGPPSVRPLLDPLNVSVLGNYLSPSGRIAGRRITGNCKRHQRALSKTIKRSRSLGLLSYKRGGFTIISPFHAVPDVNAQEPEDLDTYIFGVPTPSAHDEDDMSTR